MATEEVRTAGRQVAAVGVGVRFAGYHNAAQSIAHDTQTALLMNSEEDDTDGFHSTSVNTSRVTIPTGQAGVYLIVGFTHFAPASGGQRYLWVRKNGTTNMRGLGDSDTPDSARDTRLLVVGVATLAEGDYIELMVHHTRGSALDASHASEVEKQTSCCLIRL